MKIRDGSRRRPRPAKLSAPFTAIIVLMDCPIRANGKWRPSKGYDARKNIPIYWWSVPLRDPTNNVIRHCTRPRVSNSVQLI
jgi:hypothetical protein